ncbi:O-acyltransferase like protein-like isoform X2 [Synchiropus splendidus]|uniref:O-acyltransferase like protein-like isoform X2 n=1 Tax=Synchiropus splendidus TaxID=270530 RepID=UPI00237E8ACD|nr:O-acyltransferase like protein-like isoform X2 [Synchiropus splendidus]XP_053705316.1 O-acyltransferase like protein-like isoform X2 [Synchiropus splendidus]XP_053705405.1 O-acyltransferase like protein-like isoform X2 [Synchiropus splendidus]XP_053705443.1 O-acyltransferase like protein-like isoform X2 [Synchiropus splendidus]XP_053705500.1 O-acyltransferase like protein-like isoform X2 [Synchiropus splendidus]
MAAGYVLLLLIVTCSALEKCKNDTDVFLQELSQNNPKDFAVVMYDSFGKMGSGVVGGNVNQPGSLHECLSVQTASFSGQYCQVFISQGRAVHFVGICVPDSCSKTQVHMMVLRGNFDLCAEKIYLFHSLSRGKSPNINLSSIGLQETPIHYLDINFVSLLKTLTNYLCLSF